MRKIVSSAVLAISMAMSAASAFAQDPITQDAVKAAQAPTPEMNAYTAHQKGVMAAAQAFADKSQEGALEAARQMTIGPRTITRTPGVSFGKVSDYAWSMHEDQGNRNKP